MMKLHSTNNDKFNPGSLSSDSDFVYNKNERNSSDGGGSDMDNYVTHGELKLSEEKTQRKLDKLDNKIDLKFAELDSKFAKIDTKFDVIDERFKSVDTRFNALDSKIDNLTKLIWWVMSILSAGIVIPLLGYVLKLIFH